MGATTGLAIGLALAVTGCVRAAAPAPVAPRPAVTAPAPAPAWSCRRIAALIGDELSPAALADQLARVPAAAWARGSPRCWDEVGRALLPRVAGWESYDRVEASRRLAMLGYTRVPGLRDSPELAIRLGAIHVWLAERTQVARTAAMHFDLAARHYARAAVATGGEGGAGEARRALGAWADGYRAVWGAARPSPHPHVVDPRSSPARKARIATLIEAVLDREDLDPSERYDLRRLAGVFRYELGAFAAAAHHLSRLEDIRSDRVLARMLLESLYRATLYRELEAEAPHVVPLLGEVAERYHLGARLARIDAECGGDAAACAAELDALAREQPRNPAAASWRARAQELRTGPR